jgi:hypothetical protein
MIVAGTYPPIQIDLGNDEPGMTLQRLDGEWVDYKVNKTRTTTILLLALTLAGCSSGFQYYKPNTTQQQYDKDAYECNKEATHSGYRIGTYSALSYGYGSTESITNYHTGAACLKARGYTITYK